MFTFPLTLIFTEFLAEANFSQRGLVSTTWKT